MKTTIPAKLQKKQPKNSSKSIPLNFKIKELMTKNDIQQKQLLKEGLKQPYISRLLKGEIKKPTLQMCQKIAKALNMTVEELLLGTECADLLSQSEITHKTFCPNPDCNKAQLTQWFEHLTEPRRFSINKFDSLGNENKFCPYCGTGMIHNCTKCGKIIEDGSITYCMGCGKEVFKPIKKLR